MNIIFTSPGDTRRHVPEANCCHRHEAEIERIEQTPVLPDDKDAGPRELEIYSSMSLMFSYVSTHVKEDHRREATEDHQEISLQTDGIRDLWFLATRYFFRT